MSRNSAVAGKRVVRRGHSNHLGLSGLNVDAVPFAKPKTNHYKICQAAVADEISPVKLREGILRKKAPIGRKVRFFATRNHFLNYWESKLEMLCAPLDPYGSINLLKVYRIAQSGRKIILNFLDEYDLKPVNLKAPTRAAAKKWARNLSNRRRHFEQLYLDLVENEAKATKGSKSSAKNSVARGPVNTGDSSKARHSRERSLNKNVIHQRSSLHSSKTAGNEDLADLGTDSSDDSHFNNNDASDSDSQQNEVEQNTYISIAHGKSFNVALRSHNANQQILRKNRLQQLQVDNHNANTSQISHGNRRRTPDALEALPLAFEMPDSDDESMVPGPPPSPGHKKSDYVMSSRVREASASSARRRSSTSQSLNLASMSSRSPSRSRSISRLRSRKQPFAPPSRDDSLQYQPPPMRRSQSPRVQKAAADAAARISSISAPGTASEASASDGEEQGDDWRAVLDKESGKTFWYNSVTRRSQWQRPLSRTQAIIKKQKTQRKVQRQHKRAARDRLQHQKTMLQQVLKSATSGEADDIKKNVPTASNAIPRKPEMKSVEWTEHVDPNTGVTYWYNHITKKSTWSDPNVHRDHDTLKVDKKLPTQGKLSPVESHGFQSGRGETNNRTSLSGNLNNMKSPSDIPHENEGWTEQVDPGTGVVRANLLQKLMKNCTCINCSPHVYGYLSF